MPYCALLAFLDGNLFSAVADTVYGSWTVVLTFVPIGGIKCGCWTSWMANRKPIGFLSLLMVGSENAMVSRSFSKSESEWNSLYLWSR